MKLKKFTPFAVLLCIILFSVSASTYAQVTAVGTINNVRCHGDSTGSISYHLNGGPGPIHYSWNTGDTGTSTGGCTYAVNITNPGAPLTRFQVQVNVNLAPGMNASFNNIQFLDGGNNPLYFWLQDFPTASSAVFWVRVPSVPSGVSTIFMNFCSPTPVAGNPDSTFEYFDNFDHNTFPLWTPACLTSMAGTTCAAAADNVNFFSTGYSAHLSAHSTCTVPPYSGAGSSISRAIAPMVNDSLTVDYVDKASVIMNGFCGGNTGSNNAVLADNVSLGNGQGVGRTPPPNACSTANTSGWLGHSSNPFAVSSGTVTLTLKEYGGDCANSDGWFDDVRIRKFRAHPPVAVVDTTPQLLLSHLAAGSYVITMTASNGSVYLDTFVVTQPTTLIPQIDSTNVTCSGGANGTAWVLQNIGGSPHYTYAWSNGRTTDTVTGLAAASYSVIVTDSFNCTASASVHITQPSSVLSITMDSTNIPCFGQNNGKAWVTATGGSPAYTFVWSVPQNSDTIRNLSPGFYQVTVTDATGCRDSAIVNITQPASALSLTMDSINVLCHGQSTGQAGVVATGGTAGYTYAWNTAAIVDTISAIPAAPYTVVVTDAHQCTASGSVNVTEPAAPLTDSPVVSNITCKGFTDGKIVATASGGTAGYTYAWSNGGTVDSITNLSPATYTVNIQDANGCTVSASATITPSTDSVVIDSAATDAICGLPNGTITANPSGGTGPYVYAWSNGAATQTINSLAGAIYSVQVTDAIGCFSSRTISIAQFPALVYTVTTQDDICNQNKGVATINITSGTQPYTYGWSPTITGQSQLGADTYMLTVTDSKGCAVADTFMINNIGLPPNPSFGASDTVVCPGLKLLISPGNFPSYLWQDNSTLPTYTVAAAGIYTVTVTAGTGCSKTISISVTEKCNSEVIFPTAFSPNGDGHNDNFHPVYSPDLARYHMRIFNRWGQLLFESWDFTTGWDGRFKNTSQPIGTYVWMADYAFTDGKTQSQSGNITIVR